MRCMNLGRVYVFLSFLFSSSVFFFSAEVGNGYMFRERDGETRNERTSNGFCGCLLMSILCHVVYDEAGGISHSGSILPCIYLSHKINKSTTPFTVVVFLFCFFD